MTRSFNPHLLADKIQENCPEVIFCFLLGSARDGLLGPESDVDIAVFIQEKPKPDDFFDISDAASSIIPDRKIDIGFLNGAEPVYRFEALRGRLLFTRDRESYLTFFSLTCREYESQMVSYVRQHRYRLEARRMGENSPNGKKPAETA